MKRNNIAFIGAGFQATTNIFPAAIEAAISITALATRNSDSAQAALTRLGSKGKAYGDYKLMVQQETVDSVVIVAQPKDQYEIALGCLELGAKRFIKPTITLALFAIAASLINAA